MRTHGAHFAEAVGVRLNLPTEGARSVRIPGAFIVLARGQVAMEHATNANCDAHAAVTLIVTGVAAKSDGKSRRGSPDERIMRATSGPALHVRGAADEPQNWAWPGGE